MSLVSASWVVGLGEPPRALSVTRESHAEWYPDGVTERSCESVAPSYRAISVANFLDAWQNLVQLPEL